MKADTLREITARALAVPKNVTITTSTDPAEHNLAVARFLSYARQDVPALVEEVYRLQAEISRLRREVSQLESASRTREEPP